MRVALVGCPGAWIMAAPHRRDTQTHGAANPGPWSLARLAARQVAPPRHGPFGRAIVGGWPVPAAWPIRLVGLRRLAPGYYHGQLQGQAPC